MRLHDWIRDRIEKTPGLTQKGLAERMGLDPAAVNRMLYGKRNIMADELPRIEAYLGAKFTQPAEPSPAAGLSASPPRAQSGQGAQTGAPGAPDFDPNTPLPETPPGHYPGFSEPPPPPWYGPVPAGPGLVPVYGYAAASLDKGLNLSNGEIVDWAPRHPALHGIRDGFAIYVVSTSMEPRYFPGELIYIHPGRLPDKGKDCVVEMKGGDAYLKCYLGQTEQAVKLSQYNPQESISLPKSEIKAIYAVVGRG